MRSIKIKSSFFKKIIFLFLSISFIGCSEKEKEVFIPKSILNYIPNNTSLVFRVNKMEEAKELLVKNNLIEQTNSIKYLNYFNIEPLTKELNTGQSLLCFSSIRNQKFEYTLVKKTKDTIQRKELHKLSNFEQQKHSEKEFLKFKNEDTDLFLVYKDDMLILSSSVNIIKNVIDETNDDIFDKNFARAFFKSSSENPMSIVANGKKLEQIKDEILPSSCLEKIPVFDEWIKMDVFITDDDIKLEATINNVLDLPIFNLFKNTVANNSKIAQVIPFDAKEFISYTYDNYPILKNNLADAQNKEFTELPNTLDDLLHHASEISTISYRGEKLLGFQSKDIYSFKKKYNTEILEKYLRINIYRFDPPNTFDIIMNPLVENFKANFYFVYKDFIVFASNIDILKKCIINIKNNNTINNHEWYTKTVKHIPDSTSVLVFNTPKDLISEINPLMENNTDEENIDEGLVDEDTTDENLVDEENNTNEDNINDDLVANDFYSVGLSINKAAINIVFNKVLDTKSIASVEVVASAKLQNDLLGAPIFVKNSLRDDLDIIVQDVDNLLYLISNTGEIIWTKRLDGAIIGEIKQISLKNGYHFVFNTTSSLYMLDNYGNDASGFPVKLEPEVQLPLVILNHDKKKGYQLVLTQEKSTITYNTQGEIANGLKHKVIESKLIAPPKYIERWGWKYLVFQEESGELNLAKIGKKKGINITKRIEFSGNEWYNYGNYIVSTNKKGQLVLLDMESSKVVLKDLQLEEDHTFFIHNEEIFTLSGNILTIGDYKVELQKDVPYSDPKLVFINKALYMTVTDLQSNEVYLYDSHGVLFPNFPVPGSSQISFDNMDEDSRMEFVTKGDSDTIIIYKL